MVVAVAGQKGGSGKTTIALNIALEWQRRGARVLLIDADPQQTLSTWSDVAVEHGQSVPTVTAMGGRMHHPSQLPALAQTYDVTVIDGPPRHGDIQRAALMVADLVLVPCGPSSADVWALAETIELIQQAQTLRPHLQAAVLLTRKISRTAISRGLRKAVADSGLPVLRSELGYRVAYAESLALGQSVIAHPKSAAATEVVALVNELSTLAAQVNHAA